MSGAFTAYFEVGNFDTAAIADDTLIADALEFTAVAFPFLCGTENAFAEKTVALRAEGAVVDGLWLLNFAVRPCTNCFCRCKLYFETGKILNITHCRSPCQNQRRPCRSAPGHVR